MSVEGFSLSQQKPVTETHEEIFEKSEESDKDCCAEGSCDCCERCDDYSCDDCRGCNNCDDEVDFTYRYEELLDLTKVLLDSKWIKESPVAVDVLTRVSKALTDEIQASGYTYLEDEEIAVENTNGESEGKVETCDHEKCENFNADHHKECQPCDEECKTVCLIEHKVDEEVEKNEF